MSLKPLHDPLGSPSGAGHALIRYAFLALLALGRPALTVLVIAFAVQYLGLLAERWYFLANANHPQNLYYQAIS